MKIAYCPLLVLVVIQTVQADWFQDLVNSAHDKIVEGADFLKEKAAPAVRNKFIEIKETLQDPETHRKAKEWVVETALPAVKKPFNAAGEFIQEEVAPEVRKIVEAYKKSGETGSEEKED